MGHILIKRKRQSPYLSPCNNLIPHDEVWRTSGRVRAQRPDAGGCAFACKTAAWASLTHPSSVCAAFAHRVVMKLPARAQGGRRQRGLVS